MKFADLVDEYLTIEPDARGWTASYVSSTRGALEAQVLPRIGGRACHRLTRRDFAELARQVRAGCSDGYARLVLATLGRVWRYGVDAGHVPTNARGWATVGVPQRSHQGGGSSFVDPSARPSTDAVEALVAELPSPYDVAALVSAYAGLRFGEMAALEDEDIDTDRGVIKIRRQVSHPRGIETVDLPKHHKTRETFVAGRIAAPLAELVEAPGWLLFPTPTGTYLRAPNFYSRVFRPACVRAGWPRDRDGSWRWSWHSLRHHFCTWLLASGLPVEDVAMFAGHSTPAVTLSTYVGVGENAADRARQLTAV